MFTRPTVRRSNEDLPRIKKVSRAAGAKAAPTRPDAGRRGVKSQAAGRAEPVASLRHNGDLDPARFLVKLGAGKVAREYEPGASVFSQGEVADAVFYLQKGKVKLTVVSKRGKEAVVAILPDASFFGEGCLAGQPLRMASAAAV